MSKHNYIWQGIDQNGKRTQGLLTANNNSDVMQQLLKQSITIIKLRKQKKFFHPRTKRLTSKTLTDFVRELATLINSGIPILKCFDIIHKTSENHSLNKLITNIENELKNGKQLSQALQQHPRYFDKLFCNLLRIGEQSGTLDQILITLANQREQAEDLKRKIKKAMLYPITILSIAIIVTAVLLVFVVPQFAKIYAGFGAALPPYTQFIINLANLTQTYGLQTLIALTTIGITLKLLKQKYQALAIFWDNLILKIPVIGKILTKAILARVTYCLAIAYRAGLPLAASLKLVATIANNHIYDKAINQIHTDVTAGIGLTQALEQQELFPKRATQMISVGEQSGELDSMLSKVAEYYTNEVNNVVDNLQNLLEPAIMVILGILIGGLVTGMYLPIFKLGTVI
ncbi:MAG: type II secretion system F family protein [Gammaproteobacteria bacterium]|nr:type II secretion system F family protein [Gammaproteobacteria bacterium]